MSSFKEKLKETENALQCFRDQVKIKEMCLQSMLSNFKEMKKSEMIKFYQRNAEQGSLLDRSCQVALEGIFLQSQKQRIMYTAANLFYNISKTLLDIAEFISRKQTHSPIPPCTPKAILCQFPKQSKMQQKGVNRPRSTKTQPKNRDNWKRIY